MLIIIIIILVALYVSFIVINPPLPITKLLCSFLPFPFSLLRSFATTISLSVVLQILQRLISINVPLIFHILYPLFRQEKVPGRCSRKSYYCYKGEDGLEYRPYRYTSKGPEPGRYDCLSFFLPAISMGTSEQTNIFQGRANLQIRIHTIQKHNKCNEDESQEEDSQDLDDGEQDGDIACCTENLEARGYEGGYLLERGVDLAGVGYTHLGW